MADEDCWQEIVCPITEFKDKTIRLEFTATHDTMRYIFLDNISIYDAHSRLNDVKVSGEDKPVEYFNLQGMKVENPSDGIYIRRHGEKTDKLRIK